MSYLFDDLVSQLNKQIETKDFNSAMSQIRDFVQYVHSCPESIASVFSSVELDLICDKLGKEYFKNRMLPSSENDLASNRIVSIATMLGRYGGHTRVLKDVIDNLPGFKHTILITSYETNEDIQFLQGFFGENVEIKIAPRLNAISDVMDWLFDNLTQTFPRKIFLFNHHQDVAAIATSAAMTKYSEVYFFHHADHHLALGIRIDGFKHVDLHNIGFFNCKNCEGVIDNFYLPIAIKDEGKVEDFDSMEFRTCSSGTSGKFFADYDYSYIDMIVERLNNANGVHYHIGPLDEQQLKDIRFNLQMHSIDIGRFRHVSWVQNVWGFLKENRINLYISSFPFGGGRASIEAMGAGIPLLMHESYISEFYGGADLVYKNAFIWKKPRDYIQIFKELDFDLSILRSHSVESRMFYEKNYSFVIFKKGLDALLDGGEALIPPAIREFKSDRLKSILNTRKAMDKRLEEKDSMIKKLENDIQVIYSSSSWRITALLRSITSFFRKFK